MIYLLVIIFASLLFIIAGRRSSLRSFALVAGFTALWLVAGLRAPSVGTDTSSYLDFFNYSVASNIDISSLLNPWGIFNVDDGFEKGFKLYTYAIARLTTDFTIYLLITYGLIYLAFFNFVRRYSTNYFLSFCIFFALFFFSSMNAMRQFIALAIIAWGFHYIVTRKPVRYLLVISAATLFHQASVVMLIAYVLYGKKFTSLNFVLYIAGAVASLPLVGPAVKLLSSTNIRYETYVDKISVLKIGAFLMTGFYLLVLLALYYLYKNSKPRLSEKISTQAGDNEKMANFFMHMASLTVAACIISIPMTGFNRFIEYFSIFSIISIPFMLRYSRNVTTTSIGVLMAIVIFIYASTTILLRPDWLSVVPYAPIQ